MLSACVCHFYSGMPAHKRADALSVVSGWVGVGSGVGMTALTLTLAPLIVAESPLKLAYTFILPSDCTFDVLAGIEILPL